MTERKFRSVSLPKPLLAESELIIGNFPSLGYTTLGDFVKDAVREKNKRTKDEIRQGWRGSWSDLTKKLLEIEEFQKDETDTKLDELAELKVENEELKKRLEDLEKKFG